jgi:outer membrane receptor protein involved in Fe transport
MRGHVVEHSARITGTLLVILILSLSLSSPLHPGTTGKVRGIVTDASSGQPIFGVSVYIEGTAQGALTDPDGNYVILNVPSGTWTLIASVIGRGTVRNEEVRVMADLTTRVDFFLEAEAVELPGITVIAERPIIQKDLTSSMKVLSQREIESLPVLSLEDVLKIQPGFSVDAEDEIHVRGGRANELTYYIDGFLVEDPLFGGFGASVNNDAIAELEVLSGTFNAEYGDALSGVVNIITREGGESFTGMLEYESPVLGDGPYRQEDWAGQGIDSQRDPETGTSLYNPLDVFDLDFAPPSPGIISTFFAGPLPHVDASFFTSYRSTNENSWLPFGYDLTDDFQWKLTTKPSSVTKLSFTGQHTDETSLGYSHSWKYRPMNRASSQSTSDRVGISFTHSLSERLYYNILASKTRIGYDTNVGGKLPGEYEEWGTDPSLSFIVKGDDSIYRKGETTTWYARGDVTYQWTKRHNVKSGAEAKIYRLHHYEVVEPWKSEDGGFALEDAYAASPLEFALFVQDKVEFDYFIFNAGLRFDYMNPRAKMWEDLEDPESPLVDVPTKFQVSPRLGLSHPITERTMLYFSYGQFLQTPSYDAFFSKSRNLDPEHLKDLKFGLVGNRNLDPQRTTAYEFGVRQQIDERTGLSITAFNKDITGLVGTDEVRVTGERYSYNYIIYTIIDYANVKGIEFSLERRRGRHFGANLNYTLSLAKGNRSFPLEGYFNVTTERPEEQQEFYLDFDRRHVLSADVTLALSAGEGPRLFGFLPLENTSLDIILQYASGLPYTPSAGIETELAEKNSARMPWTGTVDLHVERKFTIGNFTNSLFVEVTNLTDRLNVVRVDPITGDVWQVGILGGASPEHLDTAYNPSDVGPPRRVRLGVRSAF